MPRTLLRVFLLVVVAVAIAVAVYISLRPQPVAVIGRTVGRGAVEATVANTRAGTVTACRRARISPQAGGMVSRLPIRRGDRVEAGALLLELWNEDLRAQLRLAESEAQAAAAQAKQGCLAARLAEREAGRAAQLHGDGVLDGAALDRAEAQRDTTQAACEALQALAQQARAQVEVARASMTRTVLRAPFAGVIAELDAELGEVVTPSPPGIPTPPALDLIEEGCLYVLAPIDEVDAPRVRVGQPARVSLDAYPGSVFEGRVRRVAPYVLDREKQARTVDVEVDIEEPSSIPGLVAGYSADVEVLLERRENVLRVPTEAVMEGSRVLVLGGETLEARGIECGIANWEYTEVLSGLERGETVVVSLGREGVTPGALAVLEQAPSR